MYTAEELIEDPETWSLDHVTRLIGEHGLFIEDFYSDCDIRSTYSSDEVLEWLGY